MPSDMPSFNRDTAAFSIEKRMSCWRSWLTPTLDGKRKEHVELLSTVSLLIIDDLSMRKLSVTAAEELLEILMRRYERASTLLTSNRPVEDCGKLLGDSAVHRHA